MYNCNTLMHQWRTVISLIETLLKRMLNMFKFLIFLGSI